MQDACREVDVPARVGGEEFAILLPGTPIDNAFLMAERIRKMIEAEAVVLNNGDRFHLTASFGVAALLPREDIEGLMRRADTALYTAKQNGRNRAEIATTPAETTNDTAMA